MVVSDWEIYLRDRKRRKINNGDSRVGTERTNILGNDLWDRRACKWESGVSRYWVMGL